VPRHHTFHSRVRTTGIALPTLREQFSPTELAGLFTTATVVAVVLGPNAVTLTTGDSLAVTTLSVALLGALAFGTGVLTLLAIKRVRA